MNDLPRRPIPPVPPPVGAFEQTVARARARRRKAMAGVASASAAVCAVVVVAATVSIGHSNTGSRPPVPIAPIDSSATPSPTPIVSSPTPSPSPAQATTSVPPVTAPSMSASLSSPAVSSAPASPPPTYRGWLVDAAHHPLKGYYLYWDTPGRVTPTDAPADLTLDHPAATTRADGTFDVDCAAGTSSVLAISRVRIPLNAQSGPADAQLQHQVDVTYTGVNSILPTINIDGLCDTASRQGTLYQPHATVMGTLLIDGKPYSAADAARAAKVQPGDAGSDLFLTVEFNTPNGARMMDGVLPEPGTGAFTLNGLAMGDLVFLVASSSANVPSIVDGQVVKVVVAITTGVQPTGSDATITATVVP